jgi:hypothetical protein
MQSVNRYIPDAASVVRAKTAAAIAADTSLLAGELVSPIGAIWNDEPRDGKVIITFQATAVVATGTYAISLVTSTAADLSSPQTHFTITLDPAVATSKWYEVLADEETLVKMDTDAKYFGLLVDVGGTSPSLKLESYLLPPVGK